MHKASRRTLRFAAVVVLASVAAFPAVADATSPALVLTRWAGTGGRGYNLPADRLSATIDYPESIVMDSVGNIYVGEDGGYEVAKITPDGQTTRFAGNGTYTNAPVTAGPPVAATSVNINGVHALAIDNSDNIYVGNSSGQVLKVTPSGQLTLVAGTGSRAGTFTPGGPAVAAPLGSVYGLAADASGNVYISDPANGVVEEVTASNGDIHVVAGEFGNRGSTTVGQSATSTMLNGPAGLALDGSGNLYINDSWQGETFKLDSGTGTLTLVAGGGANQPSPTQQAASSVQLNSPQGLRRDSAGNLYIVDYGTYELMKVTPDGQLSVLAGTGSAAPGSVAFGQSPTSTALKFPG